MGFMESSHSVKVHIEDRVRIEQQKRFRKLAAQLEQRSGIAKRRLLHKIGDVDAILTSIAKMRQNFLMEIGNREDQICKALISQRAYLPLQDRNPVNGDQRLGNIREQLIVSPSAHSCSKSQQFHAATCFPDVFIGALLPLSRDTLSNKRHIGRTVPG